MSVCEQMDMNEFVKMFQFTYGKFHAARDQTDGEGLNVYDGKISGQAYGNTVHRCGRDCVQHQYYSQDWKQSFMPMISKVQNVLVSDTVTVTQCLVHYA